MNLTKSLWTKILTVGLGATMALGIGLTSAQVAQQAQAAQGDTVYTMNLNAQGSAFGTSNTYAEKTGTMSSVSWKISLGSCQSSSAVWIGSNSTNKAKLVLPDSSASSYNYGYVRAAISGATATSTYYSALVAQSAFSNVGKVTITPTTGGNAAAAIKFYLVSSSGTTTNYSQVTLTSGTQGSNLVSGSSTTYEFATIASAYYALVFYGTNDYTVRVPTITFYEGASASVPVTSVSVSPDTATIYSGGTNNKTVQLSATVLPSNATDKTLTWQSNATGVATVSSSGLVTAVSAGSATITATANDGSGQYDTAAITVVAKALSSIAVTGTPSKTSYNSGESFDPTGITITATYNNGDTANVATGDATYSPDPLTPSDTQVTVSWGGKSTVITGITVSSVSLSSIAVTGTPNKTSYYVGDTFDPTGVTIRAYYSDSSNVVLSYEDCTFDPTPLTVGTTSITVGYSSKTASISGITVSAITLNSISIKTAATKTNFKLGETFSSSGLVINANYNSGTVEKSSGFTVTGVDTMVLGAQTATITYEGKTVTYSVDVTNVGANAGSYQSSPGSYNSLYTGSGMWTTTVASFGMNGSTYGTYSAAYLSSTDASASRSWTISVGNVGNWGSGTITTVAGANIGANTATQYGNNAMPSAITSMANYSTIVGSNNPMYVGMNFDATNAAKFSMKFITEKAMDAYVVYSTDGGTSYSTIGSKQTTGATDGSTWYDISYAGESSLGSSVRFGVLLISTVTSGIRNRIGDIAVSSYTPGSQEWVNGDFSPLEQATSFADYVMTGVGQGAQGNCAAVKSELDTEYAAMSDLAKAEFSTNSGTTFINARARMAYLSAWVSSQSPAAVETSKEDPKSSLVASAVIGIIGLTTIAGFYFVGKKRTVSNQLLTLQIN